jgi:ABC-type transport system involved in multi-copper enzyme maturation permease subunit
MFAGPIFRFELVRIARQRRTFLLRFLFGVVLLGIVGVNYLGQWRWNRPWYSPGAFSLRELAQFGQVLFGSMMGAQAALILGLTPAIVADAIASEQRRKTLHYLLASRLSSLEIVAGKLGARLLSVGVFPALVLPIISLLTLIGGVSPASLVLGYAALASSAYFLACLALLASVLGGRPRNAVGAAYLLTGAWLFVPLFLEAGLAMLPSSWGALAEGVRTFLAWAWPATPLALVTGARTVLGGGADELWRFTLWMVGSQTAYGTLFAALAVWQLRPAFRRHEGRAERPGNAARGRTGWFPLRPCGDDPVFWKEAYFSQAAGGVVHKLARALAFAVLVLAVLGAMWASWEVFPEPWEHGYGSVSPQHYGRRMGMNIGLRYGTALLAVLWMLWLAGQTAAGIASEREQDTWTSLLSTPLEGDEIVYGKMLGPLRATAPFGVTIATLWLIGLVVGAVHPLGLLNAAVVLGLLVWFSIALGTYASLKARVTWHARLWAQGILIAPHICCLLPMPSAAMLLGISLWSYVEIHELMGGSFMPASWAYLLPVGYFFGGMALYGVAAYLLTRGILYGFDRAADRPVRGLAGDVVLVPIEDVGHENPTTA